MLKWLLSVEVGTCLVDGVKNTVQYVMLYTSRSVPHWWASMVYISTVLHSSWVYVKYEGSKYIIWLILGLLMIISYKRTLLNIVHWRIMKVKDERIRCFFCDSGTGTDFGLIHRFLMHRANLFVLHSGKDGDYIFPYMFAPCS